MPATQQRRADSQQLSAEPSQKHYDAGIGAVALPILPSVLLDLQARCVLNRNARRPVWALTSTLTRSLQLKLWTAAMRGKYHRLYAVCQYTLTGFNRTTVTTLVMGSIL